MRKLAKKTFIIVLLCLLIMGLASCKKSDSDRADTYYAYRDGVKQDNEWIKLGKDKWSDSSGGNGRLEEKDGILYGYTEASGKEDVLFFGSVMNGVFEYSFDGENWGAYYADGSNAGNKNPDPHMKDDSEKDVEYTRGGVSGNAKAIGNADASGDYLCFGSYPQTLVMDDALIGVLTSEAGALPTSENSQAWTSYNYYIEGSDEESFMWYIDLSYDGKKYRGVYFTDYRPWNTMPVWCSELYERHISGYNGTGVNIKYDDCNPFGMIAGDFGEIDSLTKHTMKTISDSTIVAFNSLSELFAAFMANFEIPTDGTEYIPTIGSDALDDYTLFYNAAIELYNGSLVSFTKNVSNDLTRSAVIGVNHPYTMAFGTDVSPELINFQTVIANLFGFSSVSDFMKYAQALAETTKKALENGCFYTTNGSFVFPIAVKNKLSSTVLAYVILDASGFVSVWVNDITAALWATNFNASYHTDSIINNELYCKNMLFVTRPDGIDRTYQDDNGYYKSTDTQTNIYWFKYEPIKWRILSEENDEALILCDMIIDSQDYYYSDMDREADDTTVYANNYKYSTIREWLNEAFYNTAFTDNEKELIQTTTVDNTAKSTNPDTFTTEFNDGTNEYACSNTQDKVFLLSEQEATSSMYGFNAFVGLAEREILRDDEIGFTVKYDDCNPFGVISGDFGGIVNFSKHRQEPTSNSILDAFDSLSELFATFIKKDKEDNDYDAYYTDLYNNALAIYNNNSLIAFTKNVSNNNSKKSAIIGIDNDYSKVGSEVPKKIDLVTVIANMFGFKYKTEFTNYAKELTKLFVQYRKNIINGKVGNEELVNGYFYTANASFVFPIAVKNELSSTVLAYIFLTYNPPKDTSEDDSYSVYVWVNDITAVLWATNYNNDSYHTDSVIENELYCKNLLFIPNYCRYDMVRQKKNTDYAKCQGAWTNTSSGYNEAGTGYWMLRSPVCNLPDNLQLVSNIGHAFQNNYVYYTDGGVVPALRITLG